MKSSPLSLEGELDVVRQRRARTLQAEATTTTVKGARMNSGVLIIREFPWPCLRGG